MLDYKGYAIIDGALMHGLLGLIEKVCVNHTSIGDGALSVRYPGYLIILFVFAMLLLVFWAIYDIIKSKFMLNLKVIWVFLIFVLGPVGSVIYLLVGKRRKYFVGD